MSTTPPEEREERSAAAGPGESEKRAALDEVLATPSFERAGQLRSFLTYICEMEFAGRSAELSEYLIGVEALGKPPGYSTGDDSSVRKRAHDLRQRLEELYAGELASTHVRIELPKGRYAPRFIVSPARTAMVPATSAVAGALPASAAAAGVVEAAPTRLPSRILARVFWTGAVVGVLATLAGELVWTRFHRTPDVVADPGLVFEAESRTNVFVGDAIGGTCPACSSRGRVKWIGKEGSLTIQADVPTDGEYMIQVDYLVEGRRSFFVSVNGEAAVELPVRGNAWWVPASTSFMARLHTGRNAIRFFNERNYAPDLDRIAVR